MSHRQKVVAWFVLIGLCGGALFPVPEGEAENRDQANPNSELKTLPLGVSIGFFTWWWSEKTRVNPEKPPPYDEYIELAEWSAFDPIGGPDPYAFDIVVDVKNLSDTSFEELHVSILYQWKVGPLKGVEHSRWEKARTLREDVIHNFPAHASQKIKVEQFGIREKMDSLPVEAWPWALKIICRIRKLERVRKVDSYRKTDLVVEHILPIMPMD